MGLCPSIPHDVGLKALKQEKKIPTEDLLNMAEFVLKSNFFEFNGNIKQQISETGSSIKYVCTCAYQGVRNVSFLEIFTYVLNGWLQQL